MPGFDHLLAATDLSDASLAAVDRAFLLAAGQGARLTVLHAVGLDALAPLRRWLGGGADEVSRRLMDEAGERLSEHVAKTTHRAGQEAELCLEQGRPATVIPGFCEAAGVDLLVVGAQGSGFVQRMVLGSTASRLLRQCRCPVLVVRQEVREAYRRVLVAVDFSPGSEARVRLARSLAPAAELVLLHVFAVPFEGKMQQAGVNDDVLYRYRIDAREQATLQLHELARSVGLTLRDYTGVVVHGDAVHRILEHERSLGADLVVMGKHGTHVTEELLLGSVTQQVLAQAAGDVLVVLDRQRPADQAASAG